MAGLEVEWFPWGAGIGGSMAAAAAAGRAATERTGR
jgi:hypothetical protein